MPNILKHPQVKTKRPAKPGAAPRMPHERDESEDSQASEPREDMQQAYEDVKSGLADTDLRGAIHDSKTLRAPHETTEETPPSPARNVEKNRYKLPDGK
jgi:hypothetical protein